MVGFALLEKLFFGMPCECKLIQVIAKFNSPSQILLAIVLLGKEKKLNTKHLLN